MYIAGINSATFGDQNVCLKCKGTIYMDYFYLYALNCFGIESTGATICGPGATPFFRHGCLLGKHDSDSDQRQRMYKYQYILLCYLRFYVRRKQKTHQGITTKNPLTRLG